MTLRESDAGQAGEGAAFAGAGVAVAGGRIGRRPAALAPRTRQLVGAVVAVVGLGLLLLAAHLEPSARGLGTHEQLNLPACGWIATMDLPCPTCGMTTAFAHAADGNLLASLVAQPLGFLLALATAMAVIVGVYVAATGSRVGAGFARLWGPASGWILAAAVVAAWAYKVVAYNVLP